MVAITSDSKPQPFGMPIVACINLPLSFSNLPNLTTFA